jgi:hypothetical protein
MTSRSPPVASPARRRAARCGALGRGGRLALPARPRPVLIDGLFGTGLTRPLERGIGPVFTELVAAARVQPAIDLPSGLETDSGADLGAPKGISAYTGARRAQARPCPRCGVERCGKVMLADIGIPVESHWRSVARPQLKAPGARAHKYSAAWSRWSKATMPGAARLAAHAAMAGGAGYTILACADGRTARPRRAGPPPYRQWRRTGRLPHRDRIGAVVVGPGLGRDRRAEACSRQRSREISP